MAGLFEHACQLCTHAVVLHHQASRAVDQAGGHPNIFGLVFERFFEFGQQRLERFCRFFCRLFFGLVLQAAQINGPFGYALHGRAVKVLQVIECPFIHAVGHQQYFNAFFLEYFQLRAVFSSSQGVCSDVVDSLLAFFHARFVVRKRDAGGITARAGKSKEFGKPVFVGKVFA